MWGVMPFEAGVVMLTQQTEQLRNTETSLNAQLQTLNLLEAHLEGGLIDLAQVDQFRQSIETERANLLQSQNGLANTVESFKTFSLGLPPDVPIELDDSRIRQFRFVSDSLKRQQERLQAIVSICYLTRPAQFSSVGLSLSSSTISSGITQGRSSTSIRMR